MMETTWSKATLIAAFAVLLLLIGWSMAQTEQANDRLKRMEVMVAVCGDVAAYFAPNDELTAGMELSPPARKVAKR
jgi:hypothetical protein